MNTRKQVCSTIIMVLFWSAMAHGQQQTQLMTFEDAMQLMEQQNPALQQARQHIKQKEYELKSKRGLYLPQLSVNAKAAAMSEDLHLDLTPVADAITPLYQTLGTYGNFSGVANPDPVTNTIMPVLPDEMSTQIVRDQLLAAGEEVANGEWDKLIQEKEFASLTADFTWPLLTGGKIKGANDAAKVRVNISNEQLRHTEGSLLTELVSRYYGLALGLQVVQVREQTLDVMESHATNAQKLFDNGMIAKVEFLHASVARNEAERELKQAQRNVEIIRSGLAATLSLHTIEIEPASQLFMSDELQDLSYWVQLALQNNPQLKQIEGKQELLRIKNKVNRGNYLPAVAMMGTYNLAEKNLSPYAPEWLVGVGMKWTVFNGMNRQNTIKAGKSMQEQAGFAEQKAQADLEAYLTKLYQELLMHQEQKEKLESTLELAQEYSTSTEKAFNEGLATSITVVDAHTKMAQVKALRLKVYYDYDVTLAKFLQATGTPEKFALYSAAQNNTSK